MNAEFDLSPPDREPFVLAVDELGSFLVSRRAELVLGHLRGGQADLPFLADVGARHARFRREESFREGQVWRVVPEPGENVAVGRELVPADGRVLTDGDRVAFGVNLELRFRRPDPGSTTAVLELKSGVECLGCDGVLLFAEGPAGRVRVGSGAHSHLRVAALAEDLWLELAGDSIEVASERGVARPGESQTERLGVPVPPPTRADLFVGTGADGKPPFAIAFLPIEGPGPASRGPLGAFGP